MNDERMDPVESAQQDAKADREARDLPDAQESGCCGFCCGHIEGTCPDYQNKAHKSCSEKYDQDKEMGFTDEPWYDEPRILVDGSPEAQNDYEG